MFIIGLSYFQAPTLQLADTLVQLGPGHSETSGLGCVCVFTMLEMMYHSRFCTQAIGFSLSVLGRHHHPGFCHHGLAYSRLSPEHGNGAHAVFDKLLSHYMTFPDLSTLSDTTVVSSSHCRVVSFINILQSVYPLPYPWTTGLLPVWGYYE